MASLEEEARHLVGIGQSQDTKKIRKLRMRTWRSSRREHIGPQMGIKGKEVDIGVTASTKKEEEEKATKAPPACVIHLWGDGLEEETNRAEAKLLWAMEPASPPVSSGRGCWWYLPLVAPSFPRPETKAIPVGEPLDYLQLDRYEAELRRATEPGHLEQLAVDRQFVTKCLRHYNSLHMGDEYEHVSGEVTEHYHFRGGIWWVHGNFVARRKSSCCFSILPAPRTLFFYELVRRHGSEEVVTCTPLDEPVTEAYSILGFPLWWSARRTGRLDCICMTCSRRLDVYRIDMKRTLACGHKDVKKVCEMCYGCSDVLHPSPGEFAFGK